jgi:hypothetical protein
MLWLIFLIMIWVSPKLMYLWLTCNIITDILWGAGFIIMTFKGLFD